MNLVKLHYLAVLAVWIILFGLEYWKPHRITNIRRSLLVLFFASLVSLWAWVANSIWVSLASSVVALIGVSFCSGTMADWFKKKFNLLALVLWIVWFMTISFVIAHLLTIYYLTGL